MNMNPPLLRSLLTHGRLMYAPDQHQFASRSNHSLTATVGPSLHKGPSKDPPCLAKMHSHESDVCSVLLLAYTPSSKKAVRRAAFGQHFCTLSSGFAETTEDFQTAPQSLHTTAKQGLRSGFGGRMNSSRKFVRGPEMCRNAVWGCRTVWGWRVGMLLAVRWLGAPMC